MRYCAKCGVHIRGHGERCVLCGNSLPESNNEEEVFPAVPPYYEKRLAMRIMIFISLSSIIASFAIRMIFPSDFNWPIFVLFGIASAWLSLAVILRKGKNIPKMIFWQATVIPLLAVFWDWQTGWRGWSLNYLIPIIYVAAEIVMYVTAKIMKLSVRDYITYAFLDAIFGIIPVLFILLKWVDTLFPSIICVAICIILLLAIFIFQGENIRKELNKKMHI